MGRHPVAAERGRRHLPGGFVLVLLLLSSAPPAIAYEPDVHQRLTFHAAHWLNRCVDGTDVPALTPLEVRMIASGNTGLADTPALVRFLRWSYFDPQRRDDRRWLWMVNTRFTEHFDSLVAGLESADDDAGRYHELGRIVSYIQLVSAPSRALPVYAARFWRWNFSDRFEYFPVSNTALQVAMDDDCALLDDPPDSFHGVLEALAADTRVAVEGPMDGIPAAWTAFWQPAAKPGDFGSYGPAGNRFGQTVKIPCGNDGDRRCELADDDPAYTAFAVDRHLAAIRATVQAMWLAQRRYGSVGEPLQSQAAADEASHVE